MSLYAGPSSLSTLKIFPLLLREKNSDVCYGKRLLTGHSRRKTDRVAARFLVRNGACEDEDFRKNYCAAYSELKNNSFISLCEFRAISTFKICILAITVLLLPVTLSGQFSPYLFLPRKTFLLAQHFPGYKSPIHIHGKRSTVVLYSGYTQSSYAEDFGHILALAMCPTVRDKNDRQWERTFLSCAPQFFKFPMIRPLHLLITIILRRRYGEKPRLTARSLCLCHCFNHKIDNECPRIEHKHSPG